MRRLVLIGLLLGCSGRSDVNDTPRLVKEIIVRPGGSEIGRRYWIWNYNEFSWQPYTEDHWPSYGVVRTMVTVVAGGSASTGASPTEQSSAAVAESTVVALFTGGDASTRDAVLYSAGNVVETGLQMVEPRIVHSVSNLSGQRLLIAGGYTPLPRRCRPRPPRSSR